MASHHLHRPIVLALLLLAVGSVAALAHGGSHSGGCPFSSPHHHDHDHHHHHHDHDHDHDYHHHHHHGEKQSDARLRRMLPEEIAEEEDLELEGLFADHHEHLHGDHVLSTVGLWMNAMGCSLLVSTASLICLVLLPVIFVKGKPSKSAVDCLAMFGAGAMLGDAFLHQLPHAFGGEHTHSHDHGHHHHHEGVHSHGHSLKDLSVGLSILAGIVLFLLVEKLVRFIEGLSGEGGDTWGHGHHHHHGHKHNKLKVDAMDEDKSKAESVNSESKSASEIATDGKSTDEINDCLDDSKQSKTEASLRKRVQKSDADGVATKIKADSSNSDTVKEEASSCDVSSSNSNLVFGYLNLFSDGVHNFTDGMALGSAFLLYGSVGGWSRTLFLLAHELPQEIGDFGILVRSGFTVSKALFFNFLSALVALLGTALALLWGKDPGHSSPIEGFTAGGFIYISVAGVLPEINNGKTSFRSSAAQLVSLILGIGVALGISLAE